MRILFFALSIVLLLTSHDIQGADWVDYDESSSSAGDLPFNIDVDQDMSLWIRNEEQEIDSSFLDGFKYISGKFDSTIPLIEQR